MNVNKKLDRFKQWAGERMGGEAKTSVSEEFKALELEMALRHEGMERLQKSMTGYVKSLSKRNEGEDKEKTLPAAYLGTTMSNHGEEFENDSEFGQCLIGFGTTNERIARIQETYVADATTSWLESLERSLAQMKEYQAARKKLENRRLAYDASLAKMQKAKKEDFRVEEELRTQKAKYEESSEDVFRRMQDIKETEADSVADLSAFLEAELTYHDRCREILVQLKRDWPAGQDDSGAENRRNLRSRSGTAHAYLDRYSTFEEEESTPLPVTRPTIRSNRAVSSNTLQDPPPMPVRRETQGYDHAPERPLINRSSTFEGPAQLYRDTSPAPVPRMSRLPSDNLAVRSQRLQLRPLTRATTEGDLFGDPSDDSGPNNNPSPDKLYQERSASPATSHGSGRSRVISSSNNRKEPPPPPPSRPTAKKPPPPPPMKRSALSTSNLPLA